MSALGTALVLLEGWILLPPIVGVIHKQAEQLTCYPLLHRPPMPWAWDIYIQGVVRGSPGCGGGLPDM